MTPWELPGSLIVGGEWKEIRSDFRPVLDILKAHNDPELPDWGKTRVMLEILFVEPVPAEFIPEAAQQAIWFIDCGEPPENEHRPRTMDWEKDARIIFPAVNKIAGYETRNPQSYTHWWTFIGFFNEIEEGLFSQVLAIRQKLTKGKKMETWEREFLRENRALCELPEEKNRKISEDEEFFLNLLKK